MAEKSDSILFNEASRLRVSYADARLQKVTTNKPERTMKNMITRTSKGKLLGLAMVLVTSIVVADSTTGNAMTNSKHAGYISGEKKDQSSRKIGSFFGFVFGSDIRKSEKDGYISKCADGSVLTCSTLPKMELRRFSFFSSVLELKACPTSGRLFKVEWSPFLEDMTSEEQNTEYEKTGGVLSNLYYPIKSKKETIERNKHKGHVCSYEFDDGVITLDWWPEFKVMRLIAVHKDWNERQEKSGARRCV